jgi:hypothetical protein
VAFTPFAKLFRVAAPFSNLEAHHNRSQMNRGKLFFRSPAATPLSRAGAALVLHPFEEPVN